MYRTEETTTVLKQYKNNRSLILQGCTKTSMKTIAHLHCNKNRYEQLTVWDAFQSFMESMDCLHNERIAFERKKTVR